jgi:hypothetical protein
MNGNAVMGTKGNSPTTAVSLENAIQFHLGELPIALASNAPIVKQYAQQFLHDWISTGRKRKTAEPGTIQIYLELVASLPPVPEQEPVFIAEEQMLPNGVGTLFVYQQPQGFLLSFQDGGLVRINPDSGPDPLIQGYVTTRLLEYGRLHDLLFTSLSPFLRRQRYYLIHASAAVNEDKAAIFVGAPGCGKSTTVLNLALNGWGVLSNDTLLLEERPQGIYALPTPGGFSIRPKSVSYIPTLAGHVPQLRPGDFYHLPLHKLGLTYARPTRISTIYFPQISIGQENQWRPLSSAVALAQLIEFSLDRWDTTNLPAHITFLERLSRQAQTHALQIANQQQIPSLIMRHW